MSINKNFVIALILGISLIVGLSCSDNSTSPNGSAPYKVAFLADTLGRAEPFIMNPDGTDLKMLTVDASASVADPFWSPDGKYVYLTRYPAIHRINIEDLSVDTITPAPAYNGSISGDGKKLVYLSGDNMNSYIIMKELETGTFDTLFSRFYYGIYEPQITPDGQNVIFTSRGEDWYHIYSLSIDGTDTIDLGATVTYYAFADISPDGQRVAYNTNIANEGRGPSRIAISGLDRSDLHFVGDTTRESYQPAWSPNGQKIAYVQLNSNDILTIWSVNADGTDPVCLTDSTESCIEPAWSPDGEQIIYLSSRELYIMRSDGSERSKLSIPIKVRATGQGVVWSPRL